MSSVTSKRAEAALAARPGSAGAELSELGGFAGFRPNWAHRPAAEDPRKPPIGQALHRAFVANLKGLASTPTRPGTAMVLIAARNEEPSIGRTLDSVLASLGGKGGYEIAVVDNNSTDATQAVVRAWARKHADAVVLVDHAAGAVEPAAAATRGKTVVHLSHEPRAGKTLALASAGQLFEARRWYPEWIATVDADTTLEADAVGRLIGFTREQGDIAACGGGLQDGKPAKPGNPWMRLRHAGLAGAFMVASAKPFVAAVRAIETEFPQAATEDMVLAAIFRRAGFTTGVARDITFDASGPANHAEDVRAQTRWLTGRLQLADAFDRRELKSLDLAASPTLFKLKKLVEHPVRTVKEVRDLPEFVEMYRAASKQSQALARGEAYAWRTDGQTRAGVYDVTETSAD
ncbi:MAG: glycosyltransferase [Archangiaceae bacterium]|nr:glycosyltransferase [Archangiaceae bacterium]